MIVTKKQALEYLEEGAQMNPGRWVEHSKRVGEAAYRIAGKLGLDPEKAQILGYLHDIGKRFGPDTVHSVTGYQFLRDLGYDEEYANICLTHSYLNNDINCTAGGFPKKTEEGYFLRTQFLEHHSYTKYEEIINFCDLMCTDRFMTLEKRMIDLLLRKGVHENTVYHLKEAYRLKEKLEEELSGSVYALFPEIIEDLIHLSKDPSFGVKKS